MKIGKYRVVDLVLTALIPLLGSIGLTLSRHVYGINYCLILCIVLIPIALFFYIYSLFTNRFPVSVLAPMALYLAWANTFFHLSASIEAVFPISRYLLLGALVLAFGIPIVFLSCTRNRKTARKPLA